MFPDKTPVVCNPCNNHPPGIPALEVRGTVVSPGSDLQTTLEGVEQAIACQPHLQ